jgi:hypothetical protein
MIRFGWLLAAALTVPVLPGVAQAQPAEPSPCNFTLTPPHVERVSGTDMVTASLSPAGCNQANSYMTVACLQRQGSDGPGQCESNNGPLVAKVFFGPYEPGATYVSTGKGCATSGNPPRPQCQPLGPFTATL